MYVCTKLIYQLHDNNFNKNLKYKSAHTQNINVTMKLLTGAIPEEGSGHLVPVPTDADVHLRIRVLPAQEQPVCDLRGQPARPRVCHGDAVRVLGARHHQREPG